MNEAGAVVITLLVGLTVGAAGASWKLIWGWITQAKSDVVGEARKVEEEVKAEAKKL